MPKKPITHMMAIMLSAAVWISSAPAPILYADDTLPDAPPAVSQTEAPASDPSTMPDESEAEDEAPAADEVSVPEELPAADDSTPPTSDTGDASEAAEKIQPVIVIDGALSRRIDQNLGTYEIRVYAESDGYDLSKLRFYSDNYPIAQTTYVLNANNKLMIDIIGGGTATIHMQAEAYDQFDAVDETFRIQLSPVKVWTKGTQVENQTNVDEVIIKHAVQESYQVRDKQVAYKKKYKKRIRVRVKKKYRKHGKVRYKKVWKWKKVTRYKTAYKWTYKTMYRTVYKPYNLRSAAKVSSANGLMQGGCTDGTYAYYALCETGNGTHARIIKVDIYKKKIVAKSNRLELDHANNLTYDSKNGRIVVTHNKNHRKRVSFVDPETLERTGYQDIKTPAVIAGATDAQTTSKNLYGFSSVSYNADRNQYVAVVSSYHNFLILDENFKPIRYVTVSDIFDKDKVHNQGAYTDGNQIIIAMSSRIGEYNFLATYDLNGQLLNVRNIKKGEEIENVFPLKGDLFTGFYKIYRKDNATVRDDFIYKFAI